MNNDCNEKELYYDIVDKNEIGSHKDFITIYHQRTGNPIDQSTVSKKFHKYGIEPIIRNNKKRFVRHTEIIWRLKDFLTDYFNTDVAIKFINDGVILLSVQSGAERLGCKLLMQITEYDIAALPSEGAIIVFGKEKNLKSLIDIILSFIDIKVEEKIRSEMPSGMKFSNFIDNISLKNNTTNNKEWRNDSSTSPYKT